MTSKFRHTLLLLRKSCVILAALCVGCHFVCAAQSPGDAFIEGSPFHTFVNAHKDALQAGGDPALGNYVGLYDEGYVALLLRVHLIRSARNTIDIQSFIWTNDESARVVLYELLQAAQRGVKVRILVDHAGSHRNPEQLAFITSLSPNIEIKVYRPLARLG
jgi:phosphatidylserine/phosphatidylglycerophosphate/cardiolipin synthase-like enzyme